jgi:hypothetical protein
VTLAPEVKIDLAVVRPERLNVFEQLCHLATRRNQSEGLWRLNLIGFENWRRA